MPSIAELVAAFDDSMESLEVADEDGGPDLQRMWWRIEAGPLYWLYRLDQLQLARLGPTEYRGLSKETPGGRACAGLVWLRGKVVHRNWDFHRIDFEHVSDGGLVLVTENPDGSLNWGRTPVTTIDIPYAAWKRVEDLPLLDADSRDGRLLDYAGHVGGHPITVPLRSALTFLETVGMP